MKKVFLAFGVMSLLFVVGCEKQVVIEPEKELESIETECVTRVESTELAEYDIEYCLTGNEVVDAEMADVILQFENEVLESGRELVAVDSAAKGGLYISQSKYSSMGDVKSVMLNVSSYTGGAHPNTFFHTWTYREDSGQVLKFKSLFQTEHNPMWTIEPIAKQQLMAEIDEMSDEEWMTNGINDDEQDFVVDGNELVLLYEPYKVAAYAAGSQMVNIPLADLQVILAPPFGEISDLSEVKVVDHAGSCEAAGGTWLTAYGECEYVGRDWCEQERGTFKECESACRHNPEAEMCTMQCVIVCEF